MFWYYGVTTHLSEVCSVLDALPGGQLKNCMFPDDLLSSLRCRMQWCLAVYNSSVSMPTVAVAETQPLSILSFYVAAAAHIRISAASGNKG